MDHTLWCKESIPIIQIIDVQSGYASAFIVALKKFILEIRYVSIIMRMHVGSVEEVDRFI